MSYTPLLKDFALKSAEGPVQGPGVQLKQRSAAFMTKRNFYLSRRSACMSIGAISLC